MGQLSDGMAALIRYANETTGESDSTLSDAVESLVAGYGGGGASYILIYSTPGALLSCGLQQYTLQDDETYHAFLVTAGTYTCVASKNQSVKTTNITVTDDDVYIASLVLHPLPDAYTEVEWIEGTGTQYIDTGYIPMANDIITLDASINVTTNSYSSIFGSRQGNFRTKALALYSRFGDASRPCYNRTGEESLGAVNSLPYGAKIKIIVNANKAEWYQNDEYLNGITSTGAIESCVNTLYLWNTNTASTAGGKQVDSAWASYKCYHFAAKRDDTIMCDMIPCIRTADNKPGLYNVINGTFCGNQGDGEFIAGPAI